MVTHSQHVDVRIRRPLDEVYEFASDPRNLPAWAPGLGSSVEWVEDHWIADSPMGRVVFAFVSRNDHGVLDHHVTLPTGETVYNPMRVIADGAGCEVIFTLRRRAGQTDQDFEHDAATVARDLAALKDVIESR